MDGVKKDKGFVVSVEIEENRELTSISDQILSDYFSVVIGRYTVNLTHGKSETAREARTQMLASEQFEIDQFIYFFIDMYRVGIPRDIIKNSYKGLF